MDGDGLYSLCDERWQSTPVHFLVKGPGGDEEVLEGGIRKDTQHLFEKPTLTPGPRILQAVRDFFLGPG